MLLHVTNISTILGVTTVITTKTTLGANTVTTITTTFAATLTTTWCLYSDNYHFDIGCDYIDNFQAYTDTRNDCIDNNQGDICRAMPPTRTEDDQTTINLTSFRILLEETIAPLKSSIDSLKMEVQAVTSKVATLSLSQATHSKEIASIQENSKLLHTKINRLEDQMEKNLRHSFSSDILLHGIQEDPSEEWTDSMRHVRTFLTSCHAETSVPDCDGYAHRLGPRRTTSHNQDSSIVLKPRPILFRLLSRSSRFELLTKLGKHNRPQGAPYLSSHLTPTQVQHLKDRSTNLQEHKRTRQPDGPQYHPSKKPTLRNQYDRSTQP